MIRNIEDICMNFLWGQKADYQRASPVAWDFVCKPKRAGGLGIITCELWNYAAIAKHLWYIAKEKVCLWVKWVHGLYIQQQNIWTVPIKENTSWYWRKILKVRERMASGYNQNIWQSSTSGDCSIAAGYRL